ncbi:hypothetical protein J6590_102649 [Homalodisca vitripennis]|nr:hypothetical protein J6590_102649 [Homalodisca vitripennis]
MSGEGQVSCLLFISGVVGFVLGGNNLATLSAPPSPRPTGDDRLYIVRKLIDYFNNKMASVYYPGRELSIDEGTVLWSAVIYVSNSDSISKGKGTNMRVCAFTLLCIMAKWRTATERYGRPREKPLPIIQYNAHMKGVDRSDQMMSYYSMEHKSLRWYNKICIHLVQLIMINGED